jgi:hypothetical protein
MDGGFIYDSGTEFAGFGRSCGLLKTPSMILEEGKLIKITVVNAGSATAKGLKLSFYSS